VTGLRALVAGLGAAALTALASCRDAPAPRAAADTGEPQLAVVPTAPLSPVSPRITSTVGPGLRPAVPPGVLSRAAEARALDRGPACPPARPADKACPPEPREAVEIEWDGAREP
jgi:hypothetical protein